MSKLHQYDFYYGAILNTIISQNPDACPTLLEIGEEKSVYKVTTNSSEKDIIVFCKYTTVKDNRVITIRVGHLHFQIRTRIASRNTMIKNILYLFSFYVKNRIFITVKLLYVHTMNLLV
mgnify:CR=1 FL=1